jgi:peptide chain release factor subunit 1
LICFEPFKAINNQFYRCDSKFYVDELEGLLENENPFGFIVIDGAQTVYAKLSGNTKTILNKFSVDLPKKHNKGGQSSVRFARIRMEKRHNYLTKVAEIAT